MNNNIVSVTIFVDTDKLNTIDEIKKAVKDKTRSAAKELMKQIFESELKLGFCRDSKTSSVKHTPKYLLIPIVLF